MDAIMLVLVEACNIIYSSKQLILLKFQQMFRAIYFIVCLLCCTMYSAAHAQSFTTISFNIRYDNPADGVNNWHQRKVDLTDFLIHKQPLFVGVQEALYRQVQFMDSVMENYTYLGVGRDDGKLAGEFAPVFYDSTRVKLLSANTIWLSETSDTVSIGWDAALPRICSYGLFEIKSTQQKIWVFNTHFDHMGEFARTESAKVVLNQIAMENKSQYPVILMGDFNCTEKSLPIQYILSQFEDAKLAATMPFEGIKGTFNGFDTLSVPEKCIDFIFVQGIHVKSLEHPVTKTKNDLWISDHLPVVGVLEL